MVSLKNSDPAAVVEANRAFAARRPDVPLHLGVTEAGMPPEGVLKTQQAFEQLIAAGIGDTIRVSLTVPAFEKEQEILAGRKILNDIAAGRFVGMPAEGSQGLNIISCPSCSRVENSAFVDLAVKVREATRYAAEHAISIAVMGCRVNGPGETDMTDLGLWCGPKYRQSETRRSDARIVHLRGDPAAAEGGTRCADRREEELTGKCMTEK